MAGAGSRSRERVPAIDELRENGFSNVIQTRLGDDTYLIAVKDSVQVDLTSMSGAGLRTWAIQNVASIRVFETNARGRLTRELNRRDISELPLAEGGASAETAAQVSSGAGTWTTAEAEAPREERMRLGRETDARTRQIVRAFESGTYEGITFPATGNARAEFFQQFSGQERQFLQRAWDFASPKERELFAAELNAFFAEAGDGRMGMMTLAKILQRMASDYLSHQGAYAQARFFTIADFYHYTIDIMEDEKTVGGAREHSIGGIARDMGSAIGRRYNRLINELNEERRAAIVRRLPGLEQVPTPAEGAQAEAVPAEAAPAEAAVEAAQVQAPSAIDMMYMRYSQVEFYQHLISRLPEGSPQLANMQASMRAAEDSFLEFVQGQPQGVQDAARWRVRAINDRRAAELSAPAAGTRVAAPVETAPVERAEEAAIAAVEAPPAESAQAEQIEVYGYAKFSEIANRLYDMIRPDLHPQYDLSSPDLFDVPEFGEQVHGLYKDIQAHFADIDAILASGRLTDRRQIDFLTGLKDNVSAALAGE